MPPLNSRVVVPRAPLLDPILEVPMEEVWGRSQNLTCLANSQDRLPLLLWDHTLGASVPED